METKVVIADDQLLLRESLEQIISSDPSLEVVKTVGTGEALLRLCEIKEQRPDLVLLDVEMPEIDGLAALKIINNKYPDIKVVILTTFENPQYIVDAFSCGAHGYLTKDIAPDKLIATIKCISMGLMVIHPGTRSILIEKLQTKSGNTRTDYIDILTLEEINIVRLIVAGESNKTIGDNLCYAEGTIKNKVSKIYEKLDIANRLELVVYAVENGIE